MGDGNSAPRDDEYVITYPSSHPTRTRRQPVADGGPVDPAGIALETRERLTSVESQVSRIGQGMERVETKLETVQEDVQSVDEDALDKEYFREHYRKDIERNNQIRAVAMWGGSVLLALFAIAATLLTTGVVPV